MSSFLQKVLLQTRSPFFQCKRFRGKINIQRPRQPHYERARVIAVTQPAYPEKPVNSTCFDDSHLTFKQRIMNPYNEVIAREVYNWLEHSKMVAVFHLNPISSDDMFKTRVALFKKNMHLKSYGKSIIKMAVSGTKYEAIVPLFESRHCIIFSPDQNLTTLLKLTKKVPQMILLGGIVENTLMSKEQLLHFANLPDIQTAHSQLVHILNSAAQQVVGDLEAHSQQLVSILDRRSKSAENNCTIDDKEK